MHTPPCIQITSHITTHPCKFIKTITRECVDREHNVANYPQFPQPVEEVLAPGDPVPDGYYGYDESEGDPAGFEPEPVESELDYEGYDLGDLGLSTAHDPPELDYDGYDLGDLGLSTARDPETQDFTRMLWYVT